MIIKKLYTISLLLYCFSVSWVGAQTFADFSLEAKLHSLSIDSLSLEEKLGLLLYPLNDSSLNPKENEIKSPLIASRKVLNAIDGFVVDGERFPFPDIHSIANVKDPVLRKFLRNDLLTFVARQNYRFILASKEYLFEDAERPWKPAINDDDLALWVISGNNGDAISVNAVKVPEKLLTKNQGLTQIDDGRRRRDEFSSWVEEKNNETELTFDELVSQGVLFLSNNIERDYNRILRAYRNKILLEEDLDTGCEKVLRQLRKLKSDFTPIQMVSNSISEFARWTAFQKGIRIFSRSQKPFLPADLSNVKAAIWSDVSEESNAAFNKLLNLHIPLPDADNEQINYVFWLADGSLLSDSLVKNRLEQIGQEYPKTKIALLIANSGNFFQSHNLADSIDALFTGTADYPLVWNLLAQAAAGGIHVNIGNITDNRFSAIKHLVRDQPRTRLKFGLPEEAAMHRDSLLRIDSLMLRAIEEKATPGGQVLVARDGVVVWNKAYGSHTYNNQINTNLLDLYDLASVTKITATIPALMKLFEEERWQMEDTLGLFFPQTDTTSKSGISIKELLMHESGLTSYIPFYQKTIDRDRLKGSLFGRRYSWLYNIKLDDYIYLNRTVRYRTDVFSEQNHDDFVIPVAEDFYMNRNYLDSMMLQVIESPMRTRHRYLYSDLGFYFLGQLVPGLTGQNLDFFADSFFYSPLGMHRTSFLPVKSFPLQEVVPTEQDKAFRKQLIHGWVHDPGAAMMGGVAGHAGLFANATDMAKMMQMYLNKGQYGGYQYLKENTINYFTRCHSRENRRGLGFDKPEQDTTKVSPVSLYASPESYGHSGFTGTLVWVDPQYEIVYVFLSNRIHPNQYNKTLIQENFRTRIQDVIYNAIISSDE